MTQATCRLSHQAAACWELSGALTDEKEHEGLVVGMPDAVVDPGACTEDTSHSSAVSEYPI